MYILEERDCGGCGSTVVTWVKSNGTETQEEDLYWDDEIERFVTKCEAKWLSVPGNTEKYETMKKDL